MQILFFIILIVATVLDVRTKKIPNYVTLPFILIGLILNAFTVNLNESVIRFFAIVCLLFISGLKIIGGGDLKLVMAGVALVGFAPTFFALAIGSVLVIFMEFMVKPKKAIEDIKTGIMVMQTKNLGIVDKSRKVSFAPYLLVGFLLVKVITMFGGIL